MAHKNSYQNEEPHHLYEIIDRVDDDVFKYGISCKPIDKNGTSSRMREQVNHLNRVDKWLRFFARILLRNIPGKKEARRIEKEHIREYEQKHGVRPRGNPID
ncbi:MAG: hypothetical protein K9J37_13765 [Saprospiraceae bacterium]|nr:hypothetical protein [Saprospiraceae bacterium]MCF8250977.1 hypothetical protein [Saprospiraceae bacterium]MCF8280306.1 hypothetical protein [Bacteroidales bacterium]MCF8312833.1 hypothetical protein [Saprospiraceae bacterium]MCF8441280.1 hypothetical protein [Saprospiraceae bacterium]